ncbi:transient receptor potential cation channel subfamily V member 6-like [Amphiura filiformis]|uniref:transient receptor potential cation channel subfamily V member 6-like n=1 Tax=Amphiura filiformis TaxID=82378 RepID=UPI003B220FC2
MGGICTRRVRQQICGKWEDDSDDEWKRQNEAANQIPMYRLVYLSGIGLLVMKYHNRASDTDFEDSLRRGVQHFLYDEGRGKVIEEWDYIQYRKNMTQDASKKEMYDDMSKQELIAEFHDYQKDSINQFIPHKAGWDIDQRGAVGETILHLCYLNNTDAHRHIAKHLLKLYPSLVYDIYEGADYYGESVLHIAIINNDTESVKMLVGQYGAELDRRATGRFFRPHDLKERKAITLSKSNYAGDAYYGEYPLAFAASTGNTEIYDYLIDESLGGTRPGQGKADPNAMDSFGNTVIHMTIIHNQKLMFNHAIKHHKKPASYEIRNGAGLTPLQLSYKLGRYELFSSLLDLTSQTQWTYGSLAFVAYPLSMLDSIGPNGEPNRSSALRTIIKNDSMQHLKMLEGQVIRDLLQKKWKHYARAHFYFKFFWALLHLSVMSVAVYLRPGPEDDLLDTTGSTNRGRIVAEVSMVIGCIAKTITELFEVISRGSLRSYMGSLREFPFKALFIIGTMLVFLCIPCRFLGMRNVEDLLFIMSLPLSWSYIFFFYRGMRSLGPLIVMIGKMLAGDLMRFSIIYIIFVFTFAQVFSYLYKDTIQNEVDDFATWNGSFMTVFLLTVGEFDAVTFKYSRLPFVGHVVYVIFLLLVPVMMLSMLIAMMGKTYGIIEERSYMEWNRQWAMLVLNMERSISSSSLAKYQQKYSSKIKIPWSVAVKKGLVAANLGQTVADETGRDPFKNLRGLQSPMKSERKDSATVPLVTVDSSSSMSDMKLGKDDQQKPPKKTEEEEDKEEEEKFYFTRALLVTKKLAKSQARTKREVKQRWKWCCRVVNRRKDMLERQKKRLSVFEMYQKEKTILMSTRDGPRDGTLPHANRLNTVQERIEPSILQYVHPGQKKSSYESGSSGRRSSSKTDKKRRQSGRKSKRDDKGTSTPTQVQLDRFENSSVPRLWSTTGVMNSTLSADKRSHNVLVHSPVMPRFRSVIQSENSLGPSPFGGSKTLPASTAPGSFVEGLPPLRGSPRYADIRGTADRKDKKKKSKKKPSKSQGVSRSSDDAEDQC